MRNHNNYNNNNRYNNKNNKNSNKERGWTREAGEGTCYSIKYK